MQNYLENPAFSYTVSFILFQGDISLVLSLLKNGRTSSKLNSFLMHLLIYYSEKKLYPRGTEVGKDAEAQKYRKKILTHC